MVCCPCMQMARGERSGHGDRRGRERKREEKTNGCNNWLTIVSLEERAPSCIVSSSVGLLPVCNCSRLLLDMMRISCITLNCFMSCILPLFSFFLFSLFFSLACCIFSRANGHGKQITIACESLAGKRKQRKREVKY